MNSSPKILPPTWPTGVAWTCGDKSTTNWHYNENPLAPTGTVAMKNEEGGITVRVFDGGW